MILHSPESEFAKESVKWESQASALGPGLRPYVYQEYPKALYKAGRSATGVPIIIDRYDVESAVQEANLRSRGYHQGQDVALAALHAADQEAAVQAANRAFNDQRMSPQARAEADAADARTSSHLAAIPETPIKPKRKGGRPRKGVSSAD